MEKQPKRGELSTVPHGEGAYDRMNSTQAAQVNVKGSNPRGQRESWQGAQGATLATGSMDRLENWWLEYVGMLGKLWLNQWYFDSHLLSLWISMNNSLTRPFLCLAPQETSQQRGCKWCWCPQQPSSGCEWRSWCSVCATMKPSVAQSHNEGQLLIESNVTDWYYLPTPCLWKHSRLSLLTRSTSKKVDIRGC